MFDKKKYVLNKVQGLSQVKHYKNLNYHLIFDEIGDQVENF
jgi:hypothetical protein